MAAFPVPLIYLALIFLVFLLAALYMGLEAYGLYGGKLGTFILIAITGYLIVAVFAASFALEVTGITVYSTDFRYQYDTFNQFTYMLGFGFTFYGLYGIREFVERKEGGE